MGQTFAPGNPLWGALTDARRGESHLFLRYSFPVGSAAALRVTSPRVARRQVCL